MARSLATAEPLGPDTLTWKSFGDPRAYLLTVRTGLLQAMHPAVSAALVREPGFFDDPWGNLLSATDPILGTVYEGPGSQRLGKPWRSLQPDVYYWAHATYFDSMLVGADLFGHPMTARQQEEAYEESVRWYSMYGMSMRPVPPTLHTFRQYWFHMLEEVIEPTEAVLAALQPDAQLPAPDGLLRGSAWRVFKPGVKRLPVWIGVGLLPPEARDRLGLEWSAAQERVLQGAFAGMRLTWPLVPMPFRQTARSRRARRVVARAV